MSNLINKIILIIIGSAIIVLTIIYAIKTLGSLNLFEAIILLYICFSVLFNLNKSV